MQTALHSKREEGNDETEELVQELEEEEEEEPKGIVHYQKSCDFINNKFNLIILRLSEVKLSIEVQEYSVSIGYKSIGRPLDSELILASEDESYKSFIKLEMPITDETTQNLSLRY